MFVKLFQQILDSSIADDRRLRHFFTDLLLCADSTGLVMMTHGAIARRIGADLEEVEWGLNALMQPDPLSKTPDAEGRRIEALEGTGYGWRILNYEHYRAMKDAEQLRETTRERVRRFRAKKAAEIIGNADVTPCNAMQKEKKRQKQNSPLPPKGDGEELKLSIEDDTPPPSKPWNPTPEQIEVALWFSRRPTTRWSRDEVSLWKKLQPIAPDDWEAAKWYYSESGCPFLRKDLKTLLNNWNGEVDRAKNYDPERDKRR